MPCVMAEGRRIRRNRKQHNRHVTVVKVNDAGLFLALQGSDVPSGGLQLHVAAVRIL
jgi:hypothetical protein